MSGSIPNVTEGEKLLVPALRPRVHGGGRYVYLVRARRSRGLSLGINLDPQKSCNFDCVYCEVLDRGRPGKEAGRPPIAASDVAAELKAALLDLGRGTPLFAADPLRDICYAGDGEPSTFPGFLPLARTLFDVRDAAGFSDAPFVLITNGSGLDRAEVKEAHDLFAARGGRFWIKLDAGTEEAYRAVCRTAVPFERVLANLADAARRHPVVVQSMFFRREGEVPAPAEIAAWARRLRDVRDAGGQLAEVQVYTVARETMEPGLLPLTPGELSGIAARLRRDVPEFPVAIYP